MYQNTIKIRDHKNTVVIAHRGMSGLETENTAAAFIAAGNRTHYGIETDIWRTKDGKYILNHDGRSGRICEQDLVMEENTLADLRALTLMDKDGVTDRAELKLCLPEEYLKICMHYGKVCVPELKSDFTKEEIAEILKVFECYLDHTCFIAFNIHNLELVKELKPDQACEWLNTDFKPEYPEMLAAKGMGVDSHHEALSEEAIAAYHAAGVRVNAWTVDDPEVADKLIGWGIDEITSNILE